MEFSLCSTLLCEAYDIRRAVLASQLFYTLAIRNTSRSDKSLLPYVKRLSRAQPPIEIQTLNNMCFVKHVFCGLSFCCPSTNRFLLAAALHLVFFRSMVMLGAEFTRFHSRSQLGISRYPLVGG